MDAEGELAREQAHVDRAYERLEVLRAQARRWPRGVLDQGTGTPQALLDRDVLVHTSLRRLAQLEIGSEPLVFGRVDRRDGQRLHIGRVGVPDEQLDPLVVDWRAPAAAAFYRATPLATMGLARRRHFRARGRTLLGLDDELLGGGSGAADDLVLVGEGALLEALHRDRTGRMRDIVATLQREQDEVVRAPLEGALVVQGGPGTGKTAVALHRAAYLLYTYRERLEQAGVLLVGPTPRFLRYIGEVLPALGEDAVRLAGLADLVPARVTAEDPPAVARVKGSGRMAPVLRRALRGHDLSGIDAETWPRLPAALLRQLYASPRRLASAAAGSLNTGEQRLLRRPSTAGWTAADLPLLDELAALLAPRAPRRRRRAPDADEAERIEQSVGSAGPLDEGLRAAIRARLRAQARKAGREVFAHVVVDEAQDLSPMAWRMLARRCPSGSMTIVGDLAQATAPGAAGSWEAIAPLLPGGRLTVRELTVAYRTPREVAEVAEPVLAATGLGLRPPAPVRASGAPAILRRVEPGALLATVRDVLAELEGLSAVVVPDALAAEARGLLPGADVLTVPEAKGLEFDAVLVVEPAALARDHGLRGLYLALSRPTRRLAVLSTEPFAALPGL